MGRQRGPQGGTGFRMLRTQFWTLARSKCIYFFDGWRVQPSLLRKVRELNSLPRASKPDTCFLQELGNPSGGIPPQNATLMQRAVEEWERTVCENKAVAILDQLQKDTNSWTLPGITEITDKVHQYVIRYTAHTGPTPFVRRGGLRGGLRGALKGS